MFISFFYQIYRGSSPLQLPSTPFPLFFFFFSPSSLHQETYLFHNPVTRAFFLGGVFCFGTRLFEVIGTCTCMYMFIQHTHIHVNYIKTAVQLVSLVLIALPSIVWLLFHFRFFIFTFFDQETSLHIPPRHACSLHGVCIHPYMTVAGDKCGGGGGVGGGR